MEVPLPRPLSPSTSVSQPSDLLMLDSNDLNYLDQLGEHRQMSSYEPTPELKTPVDMYPSTPNMVAPRVEQVATHAHVQITKQEPTQAPTNAIAPEYVYKMEPPKEKPVEMYRPEIKPPTFVEPPKEKPVELYRGYPTLEASMVSSPAPVYTPAYSTKMQQQYMAPQVPTIQLPSSQQMNQITQSQQNIAAIHTMSSQHLQQTKEMVGKFENYFDKMITWMESIDKRLSRLEVTTGELQKNQQSLQQKLNSTPSVTPSMVPYFLPPPSSTTSVPTASAHEAIPISSYELESATKMQQTLDSDAELAKKLQAEFEYEAKKKPETPKPAQEQCPICQLKVNSKDFNDHVNECLDKVPKDEKAQSGFFSRFFSKKTETPTPAPEKAEVPLAKKPTGTQSQTPTQITPPPMYPAFQPYMMPQNPQGKPNGTPTPTPYFFPQPYPFQQGQGQQPMYYFPQGYPYQQPQQAQPKK